MIIEHDIQEIISSRHYWDYFKNKTVLITGASGMLPSYLVYTLLNLNLGVTVIALVRNKEKALKVLENYIDNKNLKLLVQDVAIPIHIEDNIDIIIHAASQASPKYYKTDPIGTIDANVIGTRNLLELAYTKKVENVLYFSTGEVYGVSNGAGNSISENDYGYIDILNVRSCYAESKRLGETMCIAWLNQKNVPSKIVRIFHTYGPTMMLDDGRVFADFVANIVNNENIKMNSAGTAKRPFCYITDCIVGCFDIMLNGRNGNAYNISNIYEYYSIYDLANILVKLYPEKNLIVERGLSDKNYMASSVEEILPDIISIQKLGWQPTVTVEKGFKRVIDYKEKK